MVATVVRCAKVPGRSTEFAPAPTVRQAGADAGGRHSFDAMKHLHRGRGASSRPQRPKISPTLIASDHRSLENIVNRFEGTRVAIAYHSGYGHTAKQALAVARGAGSVDAHARSRGPA
jgi:hypothetical protein